MPSYPAQRLTNAFTVSSSATCYFYALADLTTQLAATNCTQVGSVFVAPTVGAVTTAFAAATPLASPAASSTLTDLGKTVTIEVNNATDGAAYVKLREVKYQTATSTYKIGYVVVENNYNAGMSSANLLKVAVARA